MTTTTMSRPALQQTKQKKTQLQQTQPSTADLAQPQSARAFGHEARGHAAVSPLKRTAAAAAREADAFLGSILNGASDHQAKGASGTGQQRHHLDSWENYLERHVMWIDAGTSPTPT